MKKLMFFFILTTICFSCQPKYDVPTTITLHDNWEFKKVTDSIWSSATMPGNVFSDLLDDKLIEDPFIGKNEEKVQWVSETDWEYKTTFSVDKKTLEKKHLELNFEGLDTYAFVYLNDSLILKSNNAFRAFKIDVKSSLELENELRIVFERTSKYEDAEKAKLPYELPEGNRIFTRKPQFQYGWDWGPKLNTVGIWRPIKLVAWNDFKIEESAILQSNTLDSLGNVTVEFKINSNLETPISFELFINNSLSLTSKYSRVNEKITIPFKIENPKLWWPHNLGEPYLYDIKVIAKEGDKILDSISKKVGLRTIELVTKKDSIGKSFYFKVNYVPIYAKGANYIPQHSFQNKVKDENYEKLLSDVVNANMNMLRVWGGGIYENDIFYDLCDEKGILVWQDFMFACAMYPGDEAFLKNVEQEAIDNVKRLRDHPSIALWCGNNENSEGWHRWGWQANRSDVEKDEIWDNYLKVFDSILPNTVSNLTNTTYWESSPKYGRGNSKYEFEGDAHDWWIWHDAYPFEHLEEHVPRFMSEFGFQSFPSYETTQFINQNDSIFIDTDGFKNHQNHIRGFELIDDYMQRDFPVPDKPEDYIYMSQILQAYGITKGIEAHRRSKPYNMGTLYWQLNDCWPAISWSSIDFFGNRKALHYKVKHGFDNILISSQIEENMMNTWIVNDGLQEESGVLSLKLIDFEGNSIWQDLISVECRPNASEIKHQLDLNTLILKKNEVVLISEFNGRQSHFFFTKPKDLQLLDKPITQKIIKTASGFQIELQSKTFQKDVFLFSDSKGVYSDNFFDLLPNIVKVIDFKTDAKSIDIKIKSLNNFIR
ncbi:glycoside hydrolase family 2 protein [Ichthyenterobacterium sp. W332]|uniref:Beta-mannosidase B n=1 Tax=Microcosmobacter mediterraneus TaxID=3075607 RepID=A0ABU2YIY6_9FLAO|nr:glycoside hydrolase family 2 protein [Ichthyenterobacterium sp. W332]MDT0557745.1 glycoside hydrolase family 2 protein [Ichthyenterobacterium sp. W332]